ncbi:poly(A) polymerase pcnA domain protein [Mycobacterium xenopi 3993]|nr:poly(A) polymerase pcnA domain protein [Mycobacterium xenopi 3993]
MFADAGRALYLVGGSVRDAVLDRLSRTWISPPTPARRRCRPS